MVCSLKTRTLYLLRNRPRSLYLDAISRDTNLKEEWLKRFSADRIPDPSVNKVETLYTYLTKKPLALD